MIRKIIRIDKDKCNGCGLCVEACHESAIGMVNGKAKLLREDYCDGLGDCLPVCPTAAIIFEEREAAAYNEAEVKKNIEEKNKIQLLRCDCVGSNLNVIKKVSLTKPDDDKIINLSQLSQWPVQIKLVPINAPYFDEANLLVSADCAAYAYAGFHNMFMTNRVTLIGCPKLDECDYSDKIEGIIKNNDIKSVIVVRMEVPCCAGIENAVKSALQSSGKMIPWQVITISTHGEILEI